MKLQKPILLFILILGMGTCADKLDLSSPKSENWQKRRVVLPINEKLISGASYLSVFSRIYSQTEHKTHNLTITVGMRNINKNKRIYINKAEYFDTHGKSIRTFFDKTIYIDPMETVEIIIEEFDQEGGTGANFVFDWQIPSDAREPFFEGIMISTSGQQGLSFTTQGKRIE